VTLVYLWSAVTGGDWPEGQIALSQIPVEGRELRKWIEALIAAKIFAMPYGPEPEGSQTGSTYEYLSTTEEQWHAFFDLAARVKALGGLRDEVTAQEFGKAFAHIKTPKRNVQPGEGQFAISEETERLGLGISTWLDGVAMRPKKYRKKSSQLPATGGDDE
jgi:hypothetical protein